MKLAVSNIAWGPEMDDQVLRLLRQTGVSGVELAPTALWGSWEAATVDRARAYRESLAGLGLSVPALQSLLYGVTEARLFGSPGEQDTLLRHIERVAAIAEALGAQALVFGSPGARRREELTEDEALLRALPVFRHLGNICAARGVTLCIEANPEAYGCDFLTTPDQARRMAEAVGSPGIGLHFDTGGTAMAGLDLPVEVARHAPAARHFHISEPHLGQVSLASELPHKAAGEALRQAWGGGGWVSIEMRRQPDAEESLRAAIAWAKRCYLPAESR